VGVPKNCSGPGNLNLLGLGQPHLFVFIVLLEQGGHLRVQIQEP
jgi:hypothetical protein